MINTPAITSMENAFSVKGKNVVITGGNRGIGLGISTAFAQSGANVAILCRNLESGEAAAAKLSEYGGRFAAFRCDISDIESVKSASEQIFGFFEHVDVLINNAGIGTRQEFLSDENMSEFHRIINTNLFGVSNVIHTIAPKMRDAGRGGSIINISSVGGQRVSNTRDHHNSPYNVSKAGVDIFTRYLAIDLGDFGIRVNAIAPGPVHSDLDADLPPSFLEQIENDLPTHRFGEAIEIGAMAVFLASPAANQITGCVYAHDGGLLCIN